MFSIAKAVSIARVSPSPVRSCGIMGRIKYLSFYGLTLPMNPDFESLGSNALHLILAVFPLPVQVFWIVITTSSELKSAKPSNEYGPVSSSPSPQTGTP